MKSKMILLLTIFSLNVHARLAPTTLNSFISDAEIILEVAPVRLERSPNSRAGQATFSVLKVWAGKYEAKDLQVAWGDEIHDQPITDLDKDYLLFLKKNQDGKYTGAQYGRSYWAFAGGRITDTSRADLDGEQRYLSYDYPASMVTLTAAQKKALIVKGEKSDKAPRLGVKALREYVLKKKSGT